MNKEELEKAIEFAIAETVNNERQLFEVDVSERAFMFHFARYLYKKIPEDLNLDCEYNRHGVDPQSIKALRYQRNGDGSEDEYKVFPDILIHQRQNDLRNALVLEIKKLGGSVKNDERRLSAFKQEPYSYIFAVMLTYGIQDSQPVIDYKFI